MNDNEINALQFCRVMGIEWGDLDYNSATWQAFCGGVEFAQSAAPIASPTASTEPPKPIDQQMARWAIDGAILKGRTGEAGPPAADHWLYEYWRIGQQLRRLGETTPWDNLTPIEPASPTATDYRAVLINVQKALVAACDDADGPITDTIWMPHDVSQHETLFDYIEGALEGGGDPGEQLSLPEVASPTAGSVEQARPAVDLRLTRDQIDEIAVAVMQPKHREFFMRQVDNKLGKGGAQ